MSNTYLFSFILSAGVLIVLLYLFYKLTPFIKSKLKYFNAFEGHIKLNTVKMIDTQHKVLTIQSEEYNYVVLSSGNALLLLEKNPLKNLLQEQK